MNEVKKIYLSGPISGRPEAEVDMHFKRAGWRLTEEMEKQHQKVQIISPAALSYMDLEWDSYMQIARTILKDATIDGMCLLRGWEKSIGCNMEVAWAKAAGLPIIYEAGAKQI